MSENFYSLKYSGALDIEIDPLLFFEKTGGCPELFSQILSPWEPLLRLKEFFKKYSYKIESHIPEGVYLKNPELISISPEVTIEPGVFIEGPCVIGKGSILRFGAYLRGYVWVGQECLIGHSSEVKESILLEGSQAPHFNYVGNSILGCAVNLGAGAILSNLRLDRREVEVVFEGRRIATGLKKLGALVGDGAQLGCHVVTNPGTLLGKGVCCLPGEVVKGTILHPYQNL